MSFAPRCPCDLRSRCRRRSDSPSAAARADRSRLTSRLGHRRLTELEVALVFAQHDFVDEPLRQPSRSRRRASFDRIRGRARFVSALPGGGGLLIAPRQPSDRLHRSLASLARVRSWVSSTDFASVSTFVVDLPDFASHELLRRARRGATKRQREHRNRHARTLFMMSSVYSRTNPLHPTASLMRSRLPTSAVSLT